MRRKAILSVILSAALVWGSAYAVFAAGQMPSEEAAASVEASVSESQNESETKPSGPNDSAVNSGQESIDEQESAKEDEAVKETESEETDIEEKVSDEDSDSKTEKDPADERKTDSVEEEEKPETLVGAEGGRVSVGENVTAEFDRDTRILTFYSQGGTLSGDWKSNLNITYLDIINEYVIDNCTIHEITLSDDSDVMYLPADCKELFRDFRSLQSIDFSKIDTSNVTDMSSMFYFCEDLQTLDVSGFITSNVTNMSSMFSRCKKLQTLDISGFDTSNVTNMASMFYECDSLQNLNVSGLDTSNVTDMTAMFSDCPGLQILDVSGFNTSNVTNMGAMFMDCPGLQILDVSGFDTSNVMSMLHMFNNCESLQTLDVSGFNTSNVRDMAIMFAGCSSLQTLDVSGFDTSNVNYIYGMFNGCSNLQELDVSNFDISSIVKSYMFSGCYSLFDGCSSLRRLDLSSFDMESIDKAGGMINCESLLVLRTPVNVHISIDLPGRFVDASGQVYNTLPQDLSESICLMREGADIPAELEILSLSDDYYGSNGTQASFHIDAQGSSTISYQWQYKLEGSDNWNTPSQTSAKTSNYTFKLRPSYDNMQVRCIVSDKYGIEVISETRNVNVFAVTSQPADRVVYEGKTVTFDVASIGQDLTYQWYYMRPNASWRKVTAIGYNTNSLPITGSDRNNGTSYRCVITDGVGNQMTSTSAVLTVSKTLQITGLSEDIYGKGGTEALFHIDAIGKGNLTYQWQYKLAGESNWRTPGQASAKTADYVFKLKNSYDNIEVRCIVTDESGNTCTSDVRKANVFAITKQPTHVYTELGENVTFAVEGIGQNLTYQWYYRRLEGDWKKVTVAGCNTASLTITAQVKNNGSQYRCYVYDGLGNLIKSRAAMLIDLNEEYDG